GISARVLWSWRSTPLTQSAEQAKIITEPKALCLPALGAGLTTRPSRTVNAAAPCRVRVKLGRRQSDTGRRLSVRIAGDPSRRLLPAGWDQVLEVQPSPFLICRKRITGSREKGSS